MNLLPGQKIFRPGSVHAYAEDTDARPESAHAYAEDADARPRFGAKRRRPPKERGAGDLAGMHFCPGKSPGEKARRQGPEGGSGGVRRAGGAWKFAESMENTG